MSAYLGFEPTRASDFYFVSYNNEDAERVGKIAGLMALSGVNLWYDHGIDYGEDWETVITEKIRASQAVVLFFTKGILQKSNSYVQKEYRIATQFFHKKVYVVMLDEIDGKEIPIDKVAWWMEINEKQCIGGYTYTEPALLARDIRESIANEGKQSKPTGAPAGAARPPKPPKKKGCGRAVLITLICLFLVLPVLVACLVTATSQIAKMQVGDKTVSEYLHAEDGGGLEALLQALLGTQTPGQDSTDTDESPDLPDEDTTHDQWGNIYIPGVDDPQDTNESDGEQTYTITVNYGTEGESSDCVGEPEHITAKQGEVISLTAKEYEGYVFEGWYEGTWADVFLGDQPTLEYTVGDCDVEIWAKYSFYTVSTQTNCGKQGGSYTELDAKKIVPGQTVTLTATANEGYNFAGWYVSGSEECVCEQPEYTFTMPAADVNLEAKFVYFTISTYAQGLESGEGAGSYTKYDGKKISIGQSVTLTAEPDPGYNFEGWYDLDSGKLLTRELTYTFTMQAIDRRFEARFSSYTLSVSGYTYEGMAGTFTKYEGEKISIGQSVTLQAEPQNGYVFSGWYKNGVCVSTERSYTFTMPAENVYLEATFTCYRLSVDASNYQGLAGSVSDIRDKVVGVGEQVELVATVNDGYYFDGWYVGEICIGEQLSCTYTMQAQDVRIEARFGYCTVTTSGYTYEGLAGSYTQYEAYMVSPGKLVTVTATVQGGYVFEGWYKNGVCVSTSLSYTFTMQKSDVYLEARYAPVGEKGI